MFWIQSYQSPLMLSRYLILVIITHLFWRGKIFCILFIVLARWIPWDFFLVCSAAVCDKLLSLQASLAAKRARELVRSKSVLKSSSLPGKLADCASTNPEESGESTFILAMCNVLGFKFQSGLGLLHTCFFAHTSWLWHLLITHECRNLHCWRWFCGW